VSPVLSAEEAAARLASLRDPQWRVQAERRVRKLRRKLHDPARAFLAPRPEGYLPSAHRPYRERQLAAARQLDDLPDGQRASIMEALHPGIGPALSRWWVDAQSRPYQRHWDRRAFRAADAPGLTVEGRGTDLAALLELAGPFEADPVWLAGWAGHLTAAQRATSAVSLAVGAVLASAIDLGGPTGEETLATLVAVGSGEHPVGIMGRHVIVGLLGCSRREGWEFIERMLLAAQRQEGLRQAILEAADEGHPEGFDRTLATVLDNELLRFAASVRAAGVWLGFGAQVADLPQAETRVRKLAAFRASSGDRSEALASGDPWDVYLALCAYGMRDVLATIPEAQALTRHSSPDVRAAALRYAAATKLTSGQRLIVTALDDADIRVASLAVSLLGNDGLCLPETFDALTRLVPRLPAKARTADGLGVEPGPVQIVQAAAASRLVTARGERPVSMLLPWLAAMDSYGRRSVAGQLKREPVLTAEQRKALLALLGDRSPAVRGAAMQALAATRLEPSEAPAVEALLTRSSADTRRGALTLLASLPPDTARTSASRLAASSAKGQRDAATELLRTLGAADSTSATPVEDLRVTLVDARARTTPLTPQSPDRRRSFGGDAAVRILEELDEIAEERRNTSVLVSWWQGTREILFGDVRWFPSPFAEPQPASADDGESRGMLLGDLFRAWWQTRPAAVRDDTGLDVLRAYVVAAQLPGPRAALPARPGGWWQASMRELIGSPALTLRHPAAVGHVVTWLAAEHASGEVIDECLDALEASLASVPPAVLHAETTNEVVVGGFVMVVGSGRHRLRYSDWRNGLRSHPWLTLLGGLLRTRPDLFVSEQIARWYRLMRWVEQPQPRAIQFPVDTRLLIAAHDAGIASEADVIASFLHPHSDLFHDLTRRWRSQLQARHLALTAIADKVAGRLIEVELQRGDLPTPTSAAALNVGSTAGVTLVVGLLRRLGKAPLVRGRWAGGSESRDAVFSHMIRICFPAPADTPGALTAAARQAGISNARLVDLAVYAPQWAPIVEAALEWPGLADGVLWLHAHTKDEQWNVDRELRESWAAMVAERTPLSAADLLSGAVDVAWFRASYAALGAERWAVLHKAAKYASGGGGHRRAQAFAEAMTGQADDATLTGRITVKRNQDAVRALGLLPLPGDEAGQRDTMQRRYGLLREFERGSHKFGSMRQASERAAVRIGVENLARTAGYSDPGRFVWAVEAREAVDMVDGPLTVTHDDVTLTLSVSADGTPDLEFRRRGRVIRNAPAALRKAEDVVALRARKTALTQQAARVRAALESAMITQEGFTADDFAELSRHPVVAPMLDQFVWVTSDGRTVCRVGARAVAVGGEAVTTVGPLRLAHPVDLVADGTWVAWQERLFTDGRRQPFKQVFRELYVITAAERAAGPASHRYDGHQLQPRQALALLGRRGWLSSRESGDASRVFHHYDLVARVEFVDGFLTPAEADLPSIGGVYFTRRGEHLAQPLDSIPPVVFSEAMRDLDLVVSVAHAGGVDPEATASTTEMRAALIRETARLMKLENITFAGDYVLIDGTLGEYSLHLGSGTVHRRPGGAVCIIPVGSQHRGRLFLPFADDDPKTAEIMSKALLLARDREIKDPTILEQLRAY
jgi:HEAT repeat protein